MHEIWPRFGARSMSRGMSSILCINVCSMPVFIGGLLHLLFSLTPFVEYTHDPPSDADDPILAEALPRYPREE